MYLLRFLMVFSGATQQLLRIRCHIVQNLAAMFLRGLYLINSAVHAF